MGKKKLSLKPVQRGFATTSVASKQPAKVEETPEVRGPAGNRPSGDSKPSASGTNRQPDQSAALAVAGGQVKEDWEDEAVVEQAALQQLVDRLQEKGDKEVARIIKTVEFDKRLANSFSILEINHDIRDQVLTLARDEDDSNDAYFTSEVSSSDRDKVLSSVFVTYQVLARLGFAEGRILECIEKAIGEGKGWEHALEWMWLHLTEDECLSRGDYARKPVDYSVSTPTQDFEDEPLVDTEVTEAAKAVTDVPEPSNQDSSPPEATQSKGPLFQSLETAHSDSDSDGEIDLNKDNAQWASLMLELDNLRIAASGGPGKSKGKKGKSSGVILETPEMRRLKERIAKIEKEYMFSRKEADALLRSHKSRRDAEALERRLRGGNDDPKGAPSESTSKTDSDTGTPAETSTQPNVDVMAESGDEEGGLFGSMLDEPPEISSDTPTDANTTVAVRSMPIPKQFAFAGNTPKALLRSTVTKSLKSAIITYARLSGASKAVRVGLEIRLSLDRRRVWRMTDIACEDVMEAENYVSTLALSEFSATGLIPGVNWRSMPLAFRDLWEELEAERKVKEDEGKRKIWSVISKIVDGKMKNGSTGVSIETTKPAAVNGGSEPESMTKAPEYSEKLQTDFERRRASQAYQHMRKSRETLPIASFREQIISTLESSQIMVLSGETGCGKSTQLPSFILEDQLSKGLPCKIFVTEPRRISAISLAQRVSQELGDAAGAMGSNSSLVGYSIRLESKVSAATRLAFVTNGIALRMLESGSNSGGNGKSTAFDDITHIIVDEVHERSIESDFLLIVLRSLMQQRKDLKVILMSATLDAEKISGFFGGCPCLSVPGRTFPVQVNYLEDAVELAGWHIDESSQYAVRARNAKTSTTQLEWNEDIAKPDDGSDDDEETQDPTKLASSKYSARTVSTVNLLDSRQIPYDLIVRLLEKICFESPQHQPYSQATLVFMPGLAEIRRLNDMLQGHPEFGSAGFIVYPLHSTISSEGQSAVFDTPPPGVRKIVISTNIAETGVTIPDITCVIDSGKHREMRYDEKRQISRLVETYIAKSNAKQRRGRAGRVQEGLAFHLFTKARHETRLAEHPIPEMLRLSLQDLALRIKILKIKLGPTIESVLLQALDPPSPTNIQRAIASLVEVKALTVLEEITPMGRLLSKLPMDVHLGKFLLVAALFKCLDPALTIAATLNSKSPFVTPFGHENAADTAKRGFAVGNSDFLTIANVFDSWRRASDNPNFVRTFCKRNFVSQQNLQQIEELRQQLLSYLIDSSFVTTSTDQKQAISQARYSRGVRTKFVTIPTELNVNAENAQVLGAALAAGLYPKLINLDSAGGLKTIINQQPVAIHPSSINFRTPKSEFGTSYLTYFTILQSKKLYAWETGPVDDKALALLCGDQVDLRLSALSLQIDRKIRYQVNPKTALAIKYLREQFAATMAVRLRGKSLNDIQEKWFELGLRCLKTGLWEGEEPAVGVVPG